jgi:hypothetical protein
MLLLLLLLLLRYRHPNPNPTRSLLVVILDLESWLARELRERLALHEECRIIELGGPFPVHSSFPSVRSPTHVLYMIGAGTGIVSIVLAALCSTHLASAAHDSCILSTDLRESLPSQSKSSSTSIIAIIFGSVFDGVYELQYTCKLNTLLPPNRAPPGLGPRASGKRSQCS